MRCVTGSDGAPISCDRAWDAFAAADAHTIRDCDCGWALVVHRDDLARFDDVRRESARTLLPFEVDVRVRLHNGEYRWCQVSGEPLRTDVRAQDAEPAPRWIVRFVDIHRHKAAQGRLEHDLRTRDESLATFAHDLRNPVQTMRHALFTLKLEGVPPESRPQMLSVLERQIDLSTSHTQEYLQQW
jgi:signal transduction histidine kinase